MAEGFEEDEWAQARQEMVARQIEARGITDQSVLRAVRTVPRHLFVSPDQRRVAYADNALPIGYGQTISQPYMVALMCRELQVGLEDEVLEIGAGSGYQAAVLSRMCLHVYTVERIPELAELARSNIRAAGYKNVTVLLGDGTAGWPEFAPYDGIIVAAGAPEVPEPLLEQVAPGRRLVVPVGDRHAQDLIVAWKEGDQVRQRNVCRCVFVPLVGEHGWET